MSHPTDSDRRKKRDASLRSMDEAIAEHLAESWRSGELQSAESFGRPLAEPEGWAQTPTEFRMPFKILKNAGAPPPEVELFRKRATLRAQLEAATTADSRHRIQQQLSDLEQALALRLEGMRASGAL